MLPAQQHLGAGDLSLTVHLGLVEQQELAIAQAVVQLGFEQGALVHRLLHVRVEEAQGVAACILGAVHGQVGLLEHLVHRGLVSQQRGTDAGREMVILPGQAVAHAQLRQKQFAQRTHLCGRFGGIGA